MGQTTSAGRMNSLMIKSHIILSDNYMKLLLELFSGTGSVGKVAKEMGFKVVSLDLKKCRHKL